MTPTSTAAVLRPAQGHLARLRFPALGAVVTLTTPAALAPTVEAAIRGVFQDADQRFSPWRGGGEAQRVACGALSARDASPEFRAVYDLATAWRFRTRNAWTPRRRDDRLDLAGLARFLAFEEASGLPARRRQRWGASGPPWRDASARHGEGAAARAGRDPLPARHSGRLGRDAASGQRPGPRHGDGRHVGDGHSCGRCRHLAVGRNPAARRCARVRCGRRGVEHASLPQRPASGMMRGRGSGCRPARLSVGRTMAAPYRRRPSRTVMGGALRGRRPAP